MYDANMSIFNYLKKHSVISIFLAIIVIVGLLIMGRNAGKGENEEASSDTLKAVSLVSASTFRSDSSTISADGIVESNSQVDLKSQVSAPVVSLQVSVGDTVYAGQTIAQLDSTNIRAQLDQARAALTLARGQSQTGTVSLESARKSAIDKVRDSYNKADEVFFSQIEELIISSPGLVKPKISQYIQDSRLMDKISIEYSGLKESFKVWKSTSDGLNINSSDAEIKSALLLSQKNLRDLDIFLSDISRGLSDATKYLIGTDAALIATWKGTVTAARSSVSISLATVLAAESVFNNAESATGAPLNAQIVSAEAGVKSLEAEVAKTIIRSPISGRIAALPLRSGELATPGALIATVVGGGGMNIKAYISSEDLSRVQRNAQVTSQGKVIGNVTNISPSVNEFNKKVEVRIAVTNPATSGLVVGENISLLLATDMKKNPVSTQTSSSGSYFIPIQNVKIIPGDAYVFTLDENSKVKKNSVILGEVKGDFVEIKSGITDDMKIVSPVYELNEGQEVKVQ